MNNTNKIIVLGFLILGLFLASFISFLNDAINYAIVFVTIMAILIIYLVYLMIRKTDDESNYLRTIKRILRIYNSDIVYLENEYNFANDDVLKVKSFNDLVKAHEQLDTPIMYLGEDNSSVFMVKTDKELLYYVFYKNDKSKSLFVEKINKHLDLIDEKKLTDDIDSNTIVKLSNDKTYKVILIKK
ncbi:MAG: hypothetical protein IKN87_00710 [Bacilli bacterium]|nr:hypothetical protein [Bacilli bacterium]